MGVIDATESAIAAADHLTGMDAGALAALRALAVKIDEEATLIDAYVAWYRHNDAEPPGPLRTDNVSIPTFLKYLESLGLTPAGRAKAGGSSERAASPTAALDELKKKRATKRSAG